MNFFSKYINFIKYCFFLIFLFSIFGYINIFAGSYDSIYPIFSEHYKSKILSRNSNDSHYVFNDISKDGLNSGIGLDASPYNKIQGSDVFWISTTTYSDLNLSNLLESKKAFAAKIAQKYGGNPVTISSTTYTVEVPTSTYSNVGYLQHYLYGDISEMSNLNVENGDIIEGNDVIALKMVYGDFNFSYYDPTLGIVIRNLTTGLPTYKDYQYLEHEMSPFYNHNYDIYHDQYGDSIYYSNLKNSNFASLRKKDLSEFNYILFNVQISSMVNLNSPYSPGWSNFIKFAIKVSTTQASFNNLVDTAYKEYSTDIYVSTLTATNFLQKQLSIKNNGNKSWYQVVIPLQWLVEKNSGNTNYLKYFQSFYFQSRYGNYTWKGEKVPVDIYMDNFVLFKSLPNNIKIFRGSDEINTSTTVAKGESLYLTAEAYANTELSAMNPPKWIVSKDGSDIDYGSSYSKNFIFNTAGTYTINISTSMYNPGYTTGNLNTIGEEIFLTNSITVTVSDTSVDYKSKFDIYANNYIHYGELKTFSGTSSNIDISTVTLSGDSDKSLKVSYSKGASDYVGMFFSVGSGDLGKDLSVFQEGVISFDIKLAENITTPNLTISLRSNGLSSDSNKAKVNLSECGITLSTTWQTVVIPMSLFLEKESSLDLSKVLEYFIISDVSSSSLSSEIYIKNIKWLSKTASTPTFSLALSNTDLTGSPTEIKWTIDKYEDFTWKVSGQCLKMIYKDYSYNKENTKIKIYTDNLSNYSTASPGLIKTTNNAKNLDMAWRVSNILQSSLSIKPVYTSGTFDIGLSTATDSNYFVWHWVQDKNKTDSDTTKKAFIDSEKEIYQYQKGFHYVSGANGYASNMNDTVSSSLGIRKKIFSKLGTTDNSEIAVNDTYYLYLAGNFVNAKSDESYNANLVVEYISE
jgi:hypothetical protein